MSGGRPCPVVGTPSPCPLARTHSRSSTPGRSAPAQTTPRQPQTCMAWDDSLCEMRHHVVRYSPVLGGRHQGLQSRDAWGGPLIGRRPGRPFSIEGIEDQAARGGVDKKHAQPRNIVSLGLHVHEDEHGGDGVGWPVRTRENTIQQSRRPHLVRADFKSSLPPSNAWLLSTGCSNA